VIDAKTLQEWAELAKGATGGPWRPIGDTVQSGALETLDHATVADCGDPVLDRHQARANAAFIAMARDAIPDLLAEVERLRALKDMP
jgi:hypothetical protein